MKTRLHGSFLLIFGVRNRRFDDSNTVFGDFHLLRFICAYLRNLCASTRLPRAWAVQRDAPTRTPSGVGASENFGSVIDMLGDSTLWIDSEIA
jgi:hypothetical protein